jgi:hypothetical protein
MSNVQLNWTAPTSVSDVDGIVVLKKTVSTGASQPTCDDFIEANKVRGSSTSGDLLDSTISQVGSDITSSLGANGSIIDTSVPAGFYYYAAFAYNAAGYSPCDVTNSILEIT